MSVAPSLLYPLDLVSMLTVCCNSELGPKAIRTHSMLS